MRAIRPRNFRGYIKVGRCADDNALSLGSLPSICLDAFMLLLLLFSHFRLLFFPLARRITRNTCCLLRFCEFDRGAFVGSLK